jgi:putative redox protein
MKYAPLQFIDDNFLVGTAMITNSESNNRNPEYSYKRSKQMAQEALKAALTGTMEAFGKNPKGAKLVFNAKTKLEEGVRCSAIVRNFEPMGVDEPPELGGKDTAMNPVELMLVALGTCQEIMYAAYAAVMDIELDSVTVDVKGYLDARGLFGMADVPPGYEKLRFETNISSSADAEQIRQLVETVEAHCPVLDTLTRSVETTGTSYLNGETIHPAAAQATS